MVSSIRNDIKKEAIERKKLAELRKEAGSPEEVVSEEFLNEPLSNGETNEKRKGRPVAVRLRTYAKRTPKDECLPMNLTSNGPPPEKRTRSSHMNNENDVIFR